MSKLLDAEKMLESLNQGIILWESTKAVFAKGEDAASRELYANTKGYFEALQDVIDEIEEGNYDAETA